MSVLTSLFHGSALAYLAAGMSLLMGASVVEAGLVLSLGGAAFVVLMAVGLTSLDAYRHL